MTAYTYQQLKQKYHDFSIPMVDVVVNGKSFGENREQMLIGEVEIEMTCGFEASAASYRIYNCLDSTTGEYQINALKPYILLGSVVTICLGYQGNMEEVFCGVITQVQFIGEEGEIPCIEVNVMDIKGIMMANSHARQMRAQDYSGAVREIFDHNIYQNLMSQGVIQNLQISSTPDAKGQETDLSETIEMVSESDYEFVVKAAKRWNYEFFVRKGTLYFRRAKDTQETLLKLGPGQGLFGYWINYSLCGLVNTVEVRGMDVKKGEAITAKKRFNHKISLGNKAKSLISQTERVFIDPAIRTREQAKCRAELLLEEMAYQYGQLEGSCVGIPELLPGSFVELEGLGVAADNRFYLTKVRHVLNTETGYRTYLMAQAPGLKEG